MGVPALFRWLSKKYPRIVESVQEEEPRTAPGPDGTTIELPLDTSTPNPNGEEFDCLYLDMNGIVHPCTHPEGKLAPETEEEMMVEVFAYTERVVSMVRPRRLLMMAIDGVAPRAKMNQQRSRRFRAAKEAREKHQETEAALAEWQARGLPVTEEAMKNKKSWDSNAITPGTPFMDLLAASLRYWVAQKINTDPGWKDLQVVISDASVPGEGEHKIMEHIRRQRSHAEHDPNTKHVIYGLDADLIMLSLATHEPYFKVLREDVFAQDSKPKGCHKCGKFGHIAANCTNPPKVEEEKPTGPPERKPFIFLDVATLREYLAVELNVPGLPFAFDLERALDDWVFLIFFVGNDFLPHLPSLEIREGAIDTLLKLWKSQLPLMGGYLTNHGKVELARAQLILDGLASQEDEIFRKRRDDEVRRELNQKRRDDMQKSREQQQNEQGNFGSGDMVPVIQKKKPANETEKPAFNGTTAQDAREQANANNKSYDSRRKAVVLGGDNNDVVRDRNAARQANQDAAAALKAELFGEAAEPPAKKARTQNGDAAAANEEPVLTEQVSEPSTDAPAHSDAPVSAGTKRKAEDLSEVAEEAQPKDAKDASEADDADDAEEADEADDKTLEDEDPVTETSVKRVVNSDGTVDYEDTVKMWEPGYRERYYKEKFGVNLADKDFRRQVVKSYVEGLSWVLAYYYQGVPSWQWYYPYHFSPFAADFEDLASLDIKFELGSPFKPFEQLMGVLPADSRASIPPAFHPLMTESDSEIIDFYPSDFDIDMNGKKMAWQGVALLPFIDEKRLLEALKGRYGDLTPDEVRRNGFGSSTLFIGSESRLYESFCEIYAKGNADGKPTTMNAALSGGITGYIKADPVCVPGSTFDSPLTSQNLDHIHNDRSISVLYDFPEQKTPHRSVLLKGLKPPKTILTHADIDWVKRGGGGDQRGGRGRGRGGGGGHFGGGGPGRDNFRGGARGGGGHHNGHQNYNSHNGNSDAARGGHFPANSGSGNHGYGQPVSVYGGGGGGYGGYGGGGYGQHADPYAGYGGYGGGYGGPAAGGYGHAQPPVGAPSGPRYENPYSAYPPPAAAAAHPDPWAGQQAPNGGYAGLPSLGGGAPPAAHAGPAPGYGGYGVGGYGGYGSAPPPPAAGYGGYGAAANTGGYGGYGYSAGPPRGGAAHRGAPGPTRGAYASRPPPPHTNTHNNNNNNKGPYAGQGGAYGSFY